MATLTVQQAYSLALQRHQAGQLHEAEQIYRQILAQQPQHAGALHFLGLIAHQAGDNDTALSLIRRSLIIMPGWAEAHSNLGNVLHATGQPDQAIAACRQAISLKPNLAEAHNNLGNSLTEIGQLEEAIAACRHAMALRPGYVEAQFNLAIALQRKGLLDDAINGYRQAIAIKPNYPQAYNNLGDALQAKGLMDEAITAFGQAIVMKPDYFQAHNNLGRALQTNGNLPQAMTAYRQALALNPNYAEAYNNLGNALKDDGQLESGIAALRKAITLKPQYFEAYSNLGNALRVNGQLSEAISACRQAIQLNPLFPQAHYNLACALLTLGEYPEGWKEYEWRSKLPDNADLPPQTVTASDWDSCDLNSKTILIHAEQGLGDAIQTARYLPLVAARGGRIIVSCKKSLAGLLRNLPGVVDVITDHPPPSFDLSVSMMSLPMLCGTTLEDIPDEVPYFQIDLVRTLAWHQRLSQWPGLKVGLVWKGNSSPDPLRSCHPADLAPLGSIPGVQFFSLQVNEHSAVAERSLPPFNVIDLSIDLVDFVETAACLLNLDLVITVDTSVAHLAGALARPTWTLLPLSPDWRWMRDRNDSPWYPTMRLFRQAKYAQWNDVVARVATELRSLIGND